MTGGATRARLPDGRVLLQHGPIDLVIDVDAPPAIRARVIEAGWDRFRDLLGELVAELPGLRQACGSRDAMPPVGPVAVRMHAACAAFARLYGVFVTPMAAVAGAVAEEIVSCLAVPGVHRAGVNNGGDIALYLTPGQSYRIGVVGDLAEPRVGAATRIDAGSPVRGVATSGWRGRSQSMGIADSVTALARTAALADAAATLIANHVDVDHSVVRRAPASRMREGSDLGDRLVTVAVGELPAAAVETALDRGARFARRCIEDGLIEQAMLSLAGRHRVIGSASDGADALCLRSPPACAARQVIGRVA